MCGLLGYAGNINHLDEFKKVFSELEHRGPDDTEIMVIRNEASLAFHRLSIMDLSHKGDQPFINPENRNILVCNGEIYNYQKLKKDLEQNFVFKSQSDCEVLLPLYQKLGMELFCQSLDAEFALVLWDESEKKLKAARDPIGIRPLFYGHTLEHKIIFASEAKVLLPYCHKVYPFPPGHYYDGENFKPYINLTDVKKYSTDSIETVYKNIRELLIEGVRKRLTADAPVGFLLSGGLDSSLVCSIAHRILNKPITTFSVGLDHNPIDIKYAKIVADYLKTDHHEVYFNKQQTLSILPKLIYHLETWDITTVRASIGMYLVCQYIREKTPIKVVLTGEISDELFGYKYTDFAPSAEAFQLEAKKRIDELYMYDVLRADRSIAAHSLEARVPFGDLSFVDYVMKIDPRLKMNTTGVGKYILRKSFEADKLLPDEILWRDKAAFSDAVGHSMVDYLKEYAEEMYSDEAYIAGQKKYSFATPISKESLLYRDIFEQHFPHQAHLIKDFWLPNKEWANCNVTDPSARVLPNYGKSGE